MLGAGQLCVHMFPAARAQGEALDNIYSLLKQYINLCNAKRRRQRERWKITIRLISQKSKFARAAHFWTFLCCCFARLQSETRRNFLVTRFMEEMWYVFLFTLFFFFTAAHFYLGGRLAFLIFSPLLQIFMFFFQQKMSSFVFSLSLYLPVALFLVELRWLVAYFLFFSVFLFIYIPNLRTWQSKLNTLDAFRFRLYWLFSCLCLTRRGWLRDFPPK